VDGAAGAMAIVRGGGSSRLVDEVGGGVAIVDLGEAVVAFRCATSPTDDDVWWSACDQNGLRRERWRCRRMASMLKLGEREASSWS